MVNRLKISIDYYWFWFFDKIMATDGAGGLSDFYVRKTANTHGHVLNTTASDSSLSNGIVKPQHQTLKGQMKCMLYSAILGTEICVDAITYTIWLYNRLYHSMIKMTSIQDYSEKI